MPENSIAYKSKACCHGDMVMTVMQLYMEMYTHRTHVVDQENANLYQLATC